MNISCNSFISFFFIKSQTGGTFKYFSISEDLKKWPLGISSVTSLLIIFDKGKFPSPYNQRDFLEVKKGTFLSLLFFFFYLRCFIKGQISSRLGHTWKDSYGIYFPDLFVRSSDVHN